MDEFVPLVKTARQRGYYTIVCDGYADGPAKAYADRSYNVDIRKVDEVADICREEAVDGIETENKLSPSGCISERGQTIIFF